MADVWTEERVATMLEVLERLTKATEDVARALTEKNERGTLPLTWIGSELHMINQKYQRT